jgi:hypothetical protein
LGAPSAREEKERKRKRKGRKKGGGFWKFPVA